ncbi:MAG: transposase [Ignavibacteria bacterium GWA2_55_11]|nr:MAG: transposase [Ignavibacteria bacterium GWA2_55_11]OGU44359.1 MAG: transposase [Ignavibacteria bacterium GWC2_56_12]OGU70052.1 MAG: transposase [Ignavibacteria bacterium RIFCSPLOWO2_02_FULL_55_14]OGU75344.1 MAG: transposase [Ignavibacteria bacterium RIFCSPLOWO2_12_FULL_56_21]HAV22822.1 IS200/IS605 family transposase [Bacteroidota bacterium]HKZ42252.1 IS200/IS605 family transposase [Candidatus Hodarchaeales archaeon]
MANTYTQIYIQIVFAVFARQCLIPRAHKEELFKYITGVVKKRKQKVIAINGVADHIHLFVGMTPEIAVSDLVRDVKASSSGFFNDKHWTNGRFSWQEGFGAFSYSRSQIDSVVKYILNQEEHHRRKTFREEYLSFLKEFQVEYDERYLFKWIEDLPVEE